MQIATVINTEEEEWLNSQLNPSTIVASETRDNMTEDSEGGRTDSIQDKVVNSTSKIPVALKQKNLGLVLTGKFIFLNDDIQNIMQRKIQNVKDVQELQRFEKASNLSSLYKREINLIPIFKDQNK